MKLYSLTNLFKRKAKQIVQSGTAENLSWTLRRDGILTISGTGAMPNYYPFWSYAPFSAPSYAPWHYYRSSIKSVIISEGVTKIGCGVFDGCHNLSSMIVPKGVRGIDNCAFTHCKGLLTITVHDENEYYYSEGGILFNKDKTILIQCPAGKFESEYSIPDGVTNIGDYAFFGCSNLSSIMIPNGVTSIGNYAFFGCRSLSEITIPESVLSIGNYAFYVCNSLSFITIPNNVTYIGYDAFYGCTGLTTITIPESIICINDRVFKNCSSLSSITIPQSVTSIGGSAFAGCSSLSSITIPESVTRIYDRAFENCSSLSSITIPQSVANIGDGLFSGGGLFSGCSSLSNISVNEANTVCSSQDGILFNKDKTILLQYPPAKLENEYIIPRNVTKISPAAFRDCSHLSSITISSGITSISDSTFKNCSSLKDIYMQQEKPLLVISTTFNSIVFDGVDFASCILHVPKGSKQHYKEAKTWKQFIHIEEESLYSEEED